MAKKLVLGNAAVAEGALESGVDVVTGYPGTPSSELIEYLSDIVRKEKLPTYVEWSVNEKVAIDVAAAAAWAGKRAMVTMKMAGLNVASDMLINLAYKGVKGGFVLYVADDPGTHAGCTEQDSRYYSLLSRVPVLDASDPEDAKRLVKFAFEASEKIKMPVILRTTTNVAHTMGVINKGEYSLESRKFSFTKDLSVYTTILADRKQQHANVITKLNDFSILMEEESYNPLSLKSEKGVIASGVSWTYLMEAIKILELDISTLKIDCENPIPKKKIESMLDHCSSLLVLEEQDPIIEHMIKKIMFDRKKIMTLLGKDTNSVPIVGEYNFEIIKDALSELLEKKLDVNNSVNTIASEKITKRNLTFCVGCQHRSTYYVIGRAIIKAGFKADEVIITGDIGCTSLGAFNPLKTIWTETTMGASIAMAHGFKVAGADKPVIATMGDSTFFHSSIGPLVNAIQHKSDLTVVVLDNSWTAMTGFQPNPNTGQNVMKEPAKRISVSQIVEALGVPCEVISPYKMNESINRVSEILKEPGVKVVLASEECALQRVRREGRQGVYAVESEKCTNCLKCIRSFSCPALIQKKGKVSINQATCIGCGACADVCTFGAIKPLSEVKEA